RQHPTPVELLGACQPPRELSGNRLWHSRFRWPTGLARGWACLSVRRATLPRCPGPRLGWGRPEDFRGGIGRGGDDLSLFRIEAGRGEAAFTLLPFRIRGGGIGGVALDDHGLGLGVVRHDRVALGGSFVGPPTGRVGAVVSRCIGHGCELSDPIHRLGAAADARHDAKPVDGRMGAWNRWVIFWDLIRFCCPATATPRPNCWPARTRAPSPPRIRRRRWPGRH